MVSLARSDVRKRAAMLGMTTQTLLLLSNDIPVKGCRWRCWACRKVCLWVALDAFGTHRPAKGLM